MSSNFNKFFSAKLQDPEYMRDYINSVLEEADDPENTEEQILAALVGCIRDIVGAHGGVDKFMKTYPDISLSRATFYKMFDYSPEQKKGGPEFLSVLKVLRACGARLQVTI